MISERFVKLLLYYIKIKIVQVNSLFILTALTSGIGAAPATSYTSLNKEM